MVVINEVVIVRDVSGWRVAGQIYDAPAFGTPEAAYRHHEFVASFKDRV